MSEAEKSDKIELNEVMLAMDVVDTLRHQKSLVDRELKAEDHDQTLIEKVRKIYAGQGLEVSDEIIARGVKALREERFTYIPPKKSFQLTLAHLYVNRGRWAKRGALAAAAIFAVYLVYQFAYVVPQNRSRKKAAQKTHLLKVLPVKLADQRDRILAVARENGAKQQAQKLYSDAMTALGRGDVKAVQKRYASLQQLYDQLVQEYKLRIVSRQGMQSGAWRYPKSNSKVRNYYIIVEAVTSDGRRLTVPITSEEDGQTRNVKQWGLRVEASVFEQIKRDKQDDGIISRNVFGIKKRGYLQPQYLIPTTGGAITQW